MSKYAVVLSGHLRGFPAFENFEAALVLPNHADVFAHIYHEPSSAADATALQRLRLSLWLVALRTEVYDVSTERELIANLGASRFRAAASHSTEHNGSFVLHYLSQWRKLELANDLRREYERIRGVPYVGVVRARPDLAYGAPVLLDGLILTHGSGSSKKEVLIMPLPPLHTGATWRLCTSEGQAVRALSCRADAPQTVCVESPLLHNAHTAAFAQCPCCHNFPNPALGRSLCSCNMYMESTTAGEPRWLQRHVGDQFVLGSRRAIDVFSSVHSHVATLFDFNNGMFAGRFVPERTIAHHVRISNVVHDRGGRVSEIGHEANLSVLEVKALEEGYGGTAPEERPAVLVRTLDSIQWGTVRASATTHCADAAGVEALALAVQSWRRTGASAAPAILLTTNYSARSPPLARAGAASSTMLAWPHSVA